MFDSNRIVKEYGISGIIMPYIWLFIYIFFHYQLIGFWFTKPAFFDYISLIVHILLTAIAVIFSHQVLLWAAKQSKENKVANFFAAIIRKMTDSPIELINFIIEPFDKKQEDETASVVGHVVYNVLYVLISIFFGYVIFIIVSIVYMIMFLLDRNEKKKQINMQ